MTIVNSSTQLTGVTASSDANSDGQTNLQEYLAGTNPRDGASRLQFSSFAANESNIVLRFQAEPGRTYRMQKRAALESGTWQPFDTDGPFNAVTPSVVTDTPSAGESRSFYRLLTP